QRLHLPRVRLSQQRPAGTETPGLGHRRRNGAPFDASARQSRGRWVFRRAVGTEAARGEIGPRCLDYSVCGRAMPELPDVVVYIERLQPRIVGQTLERVRLVSPFLVRSVDPPIDEVAGRRVRALRRLGKRIVIGLESDLFLVLHLMIAGRLHWKERGAKL